MAQVSAATLAERINDTLTRYQEHLVAFRQSGYVENQSIEPSVNIGHRELRRLSGRKNIREAFVEALEEALEDCGLVVRYPDDDVLNITKPATAFKVDSANFRELESLLRFIGTTKQQQNIAV